MIEGDRLTVLLTTQHILRENLILLVQNRKVLLGQRTRAGRISDNRLHRELGEAEIIRHVEDIVCKIRVVVGEGSAHIVALITTGLDELLEVRHDTVIGAATCTIDTEAVMDLLPSIQ